MDIIKSLGLALDVILCKLLSFLSQSRHRAGERGCALPPAAAEPLPHQTAAEVTDQRDGAEAQVHHLTAER